MENFTTKEINIIILVALYIFIMGSMFWKMSKPKKWKGRRTRDRDRRKHRK